MVGFHDATRLTTLRNSAMPGSLTPIYLIILAVHVHVGKRIITVHCLSPLPDASVKWSRARAAPHKQCRIT